MQVKQNNEDESDKLALLKYYNRLAGQLQEMLDEEKKRRRKTNTKTKTKKTTTTKERRSV